MTPLDPSRPRLEAPDSDSAFWWEPDAGTDGPSDPNPSRDTGTGRHPDGGMDVSGRNRHGGPVVRRVRALFGLVVALFEVGLLLAMVPVYLLVAVSRTLLATPGRLWRRIVGKAVLQKHLEGRILAGKQDVLRIGLELYLTRRSEEGDDGPTGPGRSFTPGEVEMFKRFIGFEEGGSNDQSGFGLPGRQWLRNLYARFASTAGEERPDLGDLNRELLHETLGVRFADPQARDAQLPLDTVWAFTAMELLNRAERSLRGNTETALRAYLRAERVLVYGEYLLYRCRVEDESRPDIAARDHEDPRRAYARIVINELDEYDGMDTDVVRALLCVDPHPEEGEPKLKEFISLAEIDRAMAELSRFRMRQYRRLESLRVTILGFAGLPAVLLAVLLVFFPSVMANAVVGTGADEPVVDLREWIDPVVLGDVLISSEQLFFGVVLAFGAVGAAISGTQRIEQDSGSLQALEEILGYWLALVRMMIGAVSAFIVSIFLFSGVIDPNILSLPLVIGLSLAAGVSERLALRAISSFESRTLPDSVRGKRGGTA